MAEDAVDIEALIAEIRQEARALRARAGPGNVAPFGDRAARLRALVQPLPAGVATSAAAASDQALARMRASADLPSAPLDSHRALLGQTVRLAKRALRRVLSPFFDQQARFNVATIDALANLARRLDSLEDTLARRRSGGDDPDLSFDYAAFEAEFRGSRERLRETQGSYLDLFSDAASGPVLDLGCGPGVFLELLRERGVPGFGVDRSTAATAQAALAGLDVRTGDFFATLENCPEQSLGGIVSFQVVEHLSLPALQRLLRLARRRLRPAGVLVLESVNLASLITHARAWTLDPTHAQPVHPLTLRFLVEQAGFHSVERRYSGAVEVETRLEPDPAGGAAARNVERLNQIVFGPQDYAVVARA